MDGQPEREIAKILGVNDATGWIYAKTRSGEIPKVPLPGRYYRYRLDVIERFERGECTRTTQLEEVA